MSDFRDYAGVDFSREFLAHYGKGHDKGGNSGRYKWGSGNRPYQRTSMEGKGGSKDKEEPHWIGSHRAGGTHLTRAEKQRRKAQRDAKSDSEFIWQADAPGIRKSAGYAMRHPDQFNSAVTNFISKHGGMKVSKEYADAYKEAFEKEIKLMSTSLNDSAMARMKDAQANAKFRAVDKEDMQRVHSIAKEKQAWDEYDKAYRDAYEFKDNSKATLKDLEAKKKAANAASEERAKLEERLKDFDENMIPIKKGGIFGESKKQRERDESNKVSQSIVSEIKELRSELKKHPESTSDVVFAYSRLRRDASADVSSGKSIKEIAKEVNMPEDLVRLAILEPTSDFINRLGLDEQTAKRLNKKYKD